MCKCSSKCNCNITSTTRGRKGDSGATGATGATGPQGPAGESGWLLDGNTEGVEKYFGTNDNFDIPIVTNNTSRGVFDKSGNFGFGKATSLTARVHIKGIGATSATFSLKIDDSSDNPLLYVRNDGNTGIGLSSPTRRLNVKVASDSDGIRLEGPDFVDITIASELLPSLTFSNKAGTVRPLRFRGEVGGGGIIDLENGIQFRNMSNNIFMRADNIDTNPIWRFGGASGLISFNTNTRMTLETDTSTASSFGLRIVNSSNVDLFNVCGNGAVVFNSILDGETSGNDNWKYSVTTGGSITSYYANTGYGSIFKYFSNNVLKTKINENTGFYDLSTDGRWSIKTLTDNKAHIWMDGATGFIGFGDDYLAAESPIDLKSWYGVNAEQISFFTGYNIGMSGTTVYFRNPQPTGTSFLYQTGGATGIAMTSSTGGVMGLHVGDIAVAQMGGVITAGWSTVTTNLLNLYGQSSTSVFRVQQDGNTYLGNLTGSSVATPIALDLGGQYSNANGMNPKLVIYNNGSGRSGIGVSYNGSGQTELFFKADNNAYDFTWYHGAALVGRIGTDTLTLRRNANDLTFGYGINFDLNNSSNAQITYASMTGAIVANTAGAESGQYNFFTRNAGTLALKAVITKEGYLIQTANDAAIADAALANSQMSMYVNEAGNLLTIKVKYAGGTVKTGTVPLI